MRYGMISGSAKFGLCVFGIALGVLLSTSVTAGEGGPKPTIAELQKQLDSLDGGLSSPTLTDDDLLRLREESQSLRDALVAVKLDADQKAAMVREDLEALGSPPEEGHPSEAPGLKTRRHKLVESAALADSGSKEAELIRARLDRLVDAIQRKRRELFAAKVLTRSQFPFSTSLWNKAIPDWISLGQAAISEAKTFWKNLDLWVVSLIFVAWAALWLVSGALRKALRHPVHPTVLRELAITRVLGDFLLDAFVILGGVLVPVVSILLASGTLAQGLSEDAFETLKLLVLTLLILRFFQRVLDPGAELMDMPPHRAVRLQRVALSLGILFGFETLISALIAEQNPVLEVSVTNQILFSLAAGGILIYLSRVLKTKILMKMNGLLILAIGVSILGGYVTLGRVLATRGVLTIGLLVGTRVLARTLNPVSRAFLAAIYPQGQATGNRKSEKDFENRVFWLESALMVVLLAMVILTLLFLWALDRNDLLIRLTQSFGELKLGSLTLSPSAILTGLLLFAIASTLIRQSQRVLDEKIFPHTRLDSGIRHSIRAGVGYVGFVLAGMLSISVMGVDLQNVAMIAGALSVGIGFGLQNIVNNFVSGLILLVERPIKAGDWVVVGEHQGLVRKISVRATQITTLDHTTVYIPNSSLISGAVQNKTHPDRIGRMVLPLTVDQDQELKAVESVLVPLVEAHPGVRKTPAPEILMTAIGENQNHLELVAFVDDVERLASIRSDLYTTILAVFKTHGFRRKSSKPQEMNVRLIDQSPEIKGI